MIRSEPVTGPVLRLYTANSDDPMAPYSAACALDIIDGIPWIKAMAGAFHGRYVLELAQWFRDHGHHEVRALRADGQRLPGAVDMGGYWQWDIAALLKRRT